MKDDGSPGEDSVTLRIPEKYLTSFLPLLQKGVAVKTRVGVTVAEFLCGHFGLSHEYVRKRIQTIFLDGEPVDDEDSARVRDGAVLALSSAMPGLLGATLRKGSPFQSMRREISHRENHPWESEKSQGMVTVKLFNFMIPEMAGIVLQRGVTLDKRVFGKILGKILEEAGNHPVSTEKNHEKIDPRDLRDRMEKAPGTLFLQVETG